MIIKSPILLKNYCLPAFLCGVLLWWLPFSSYADEFAAEVKQAEVTLHGDYFLLSADIGYQLSEKAMEALQNGVPLFWDIQIKVLEQRHVLWDKTLVDTAIRYRLQYHALLNMYRVRDEGDGTVYNFSTLFAALDLMSTVRDFRLIGKSELVPEKQYLLAMKVNFDRDALPLPLRPIAYVDPQWYLSSDWTLWPLKK
ncbi:MAG: DUF4390 domain-containing protein [Methylococcales bacterium]|nr:DUF4390 domain-containing protein [Methylococcales bacterium]